MNETIFFFVKFDEIVRYFKQFSNDFHFFDSRILILILDDQSIYDLTN